MEVIRTTSGLSSGSPRTARRAPARPRVRAKSARTKVEPIDVTRDEAFTIVTDLMKAHLNLAMLRGFAPQVRKVARLFFESLEDWKQHLERTHGSRIRVEIPREMAAKLARKHSLKTSTLSDVVVMVLSKETNHIELTPEDYELLAVETRAARFNGRKV